MGFLEAVEKISEKQNAEAERERLAAARSKSWKDGSPRAIRGVAIHRGAGLPDIQSDSPTLQAVSFNGNVHEVDIERAGLDTFYGMAADQLSGEPIQRIARREKSRLAADEVQRTEDEKARKRKVEAWTQKEFEKLKVTDAQNQKKDAAAAKVAEAKANEDRLRAQAEQIMKAKGIK